MEVAVEESDMPISVIKFATASSSLLAAGDEAGQVRIIQLGSECSEVVQVRLPCQRAHSPAYDVPARFLEAHSSSAPPSLHVLTALQLRRRRCCSSQILEHNAGVADLDWSEGNTSIVTCCEDGMVVLWGFAGEDGWECLRALEIVGSAICCR